MKTFVLIASAITAAVMLVAAMFAPDNMKVAFYSMAIFNLVNFWGLMNLREGPKP